MCNFIHFPSCSFVRKILKIFIRQNCHFEKCSVNLVHINSQCIACFLSFCLDEKVFPRSIKTPGLKIHQRFHFASALKRMSVLASFERMGSTELCYISTVKGAPETLKDMVSISFALNVFSGVGSQVFPQPPLITWLCIHTSGQFGMST